MTEAKNLLPGGVNSPVRAFRSVGGAPIVFDRVKGAYAFDVDGNKYIDYVGSWGPAICGHANDEARGGAACCVTGGRRASREREAAHARTHTCRVLPALTPTALAAGERGACEAAREGYQLWRAVRTGGARPHACVRGLRRN